MDTREALTVLGLGAGVTFDEVRVAYRRLVRTTHPDVAGPDRTGQTARLTEAYAVLRRAAGAPDAPIEVAAAPMPPPPPPAPPRRTPYEEAVEAELAEGDTLLVHAPADETYAAVFEAAGRIGHVAYFDRHLGIVETMVRFEGGPTCSLLVTLQGRNNGTEVFCTLESIEADPTPPIRPVVEALVEALTEPA